MNALPEEEKETMRNTFQERWTFFDGHTDEMRTWNPETDFVGKPNVDWDIPFVFVTGNYNTVGNMRKMGEAYMD
jgi:hypothetical protein